MECFRQSFQKIFKWFYNAKSEELKPKPSMFTLTMEKSSSEFEDTIDTNINKGSSQEPLLAGDAVQAVKITKKQCSCASCNVDKRQSLKSTLNQAPQCVDDKLRNYCS